MNRSLFLAASALILSAAAARADDADNPLVKQVRDKVGDDKPFTLVVHFKVKSGSEKKFEELAARAAKGSRSEKGNVAYEFHHDTEKPSDYVLFERWKNVGALRVHFGKDYIKEFLAAMAEVSDGAPQVRVLTPIGSGE